MTINEAYERTQALWTALGITATIGGSQVECKAFPDARLDYALPGTPGPRPARPYAAIFVSQPTPLSGYAMRQNTDGDIARDGAQTWRVEVNTYGAPGALAMFRRKVDGRQSETGRMVLEAQALGVGRFLAEPRPVSVVLESRFESREMLELELIAGESFVEDFTVQTRAEGLGTVTGTPATITIDFAGGTS